MSCNIGGSVAPELVSIKHRESEPPSRIDPHSLGFCLVLPRIGQLVHERVSGLDVFAHAARLPKQFPNVKCKVTLDKLEVNMYALDHKENHVPAPGLNVTWSL